MAKKIFVSTTDDLPPHIHKPEVHWQRAQGYLGLEMYEDAKKELRALPAEEPWEKRGKVFFLSIHQEAENWEDAQKSARGLRYEFPEEGRVMSCMEEFLKLSCKNIEIVTFRDDKHV